MLLSLATSSWRSQTSKTCEQATEAGANLNIERFERAPDIGAVGADYGLADVLLKVIDNSHCGHGSGLDIDRVDTRMLLAGLHGIAVDLLGRESELFVGAELSSADTFQRGDFDPFGVEKVSEIVRQMDRLFTPGGNHQNGLGAQGMKSVRQGSRAGRRGDFGRCA